MPRANRTATTKSKPAPPPEPVADKVELPYPTIKIEEYSTATKKGPLTPEHWKKILLGWETEKQYQERMVGLYPDTKPERWLFGDHGPMREDNGQRQPIHCLDTDKVKVVCWNNADNRPFDELWCKDLIHTILNGQWVGPHTIPGETVNGETVRISRTGRVLSGQHQGTACVLANEWLQKAREWSKKHDTDPKHPFWEGHDHLFIETILITGLSEDPRVLQSIDYVKPRSVADMLFTMDLFRDANSTERKELTRMLAGGIDLLWDRTGTKGYKTHHEVVGFLDRHPKLLDCVRHLYALNRATEEQTIEGADGPEIIPAQSGRRISNLRVSTGQCSALCYLMGSSGPETNDIAYREGFTPNEWSANPERKSDRPPNEEGLDWTYWDRAVEFWTLLAGDESFTAVRQALGRLKDSTPSSDDNIGLGGRTEEKLVILSKAWEKFKDYNDYEGPIFPLEMDGDQPYYPDLDEEGCLWLQYTRHDANGKLLPDKQVKLDDFADFLGIDCPNKPEDKKSDPTPPPATTANRVEVERAREEARLRHEAMNKKKTK